MNQIHIRKSALIVSHSISHRQVHASTLSGYHLHITITQALKGHVETKTEQLEYHFDQITNVNVILFVEKKREKSNPLYELEAESCIQMSR